MRPLQHLFVMLSTLFYVSYCSAYRVRSPPPLHAEFSSADWQCTGHLDGWRWDRCSVEYAVVWTSTAFGHIGFGHESGRTIGSHVQYTPFTQEQPFLVSLYSQEHGIRFALPPMMFSVYIQSEILQSSSLWNSKMTFLLENGSNWVEQSAEKIAFKCDCNDTVTRLDDVLIFKTNTEYLTDNLVFYGSHGHVHMLFEQPLSSGVYWLDAHASIESHSAVHTIGIELSWSCRFAIAYERPTETLDATAISSPKRAFARLVSHKLCKSADLYVQNRFSQRYDAVSRTLGIQFESGMGMIPMTILSASVMHDGHGRAVAEFLIWIQGDDKCGDVDVIDGFLCASSNISSLIFNANFSCAVRGRNVSAKFETMMIRGYSDPTREFTKESVLTCSFNSSDFSLDDRIVHVDLVDTLTNFKATAPFCSLPRSRRIHRIVGCSQPIYNADFLEARWPGLLQTWVLYHASHHHLF